MPTKRNTRGGARPGAGRKAIAPGEESETYTFRVSKSQRAKLDALGGGAWIRQRIDKAKVPT